MLILSKVNNMASQTKITCYLISISSWLWTTKCGYLSGASLSMTLIRERTTWRTQLSMTKAMLWQSIARCTCLMLTSIQVKMNHKLSIEETNSWSPAILPWATSASVSPMISASPSYTASSSSKAHKSYSSHRLSLPRQALHIGKHYCGRERLRISAMSLPQLNAVKVASSQSLASGTLWSLTHGVTS